MESQDMAIIENHLQDNAELRGLWEQHQNLEKRLNKLARKPFLNDQEKLEKKRMQLSKLAGRTRIEEILRDYR